MRVVVHICRAAVVSVDSFGGGGLCVKSASATEYFKAHRSLVLL
jgi:hypothetical protein